MTDSPASIARVTQAAYDLLDLYRESNPDNRAYLWNAIVMGDAEPASEEGKRVQALARKLILNHVAPLVFK
jgi:hypothetical protein